MVKASDPDQDLIRRIGRKIGRTLTSGIEAFGFELVKVKSVGSRKASTRLIRPVSAGQQSKLEPAVSGLGANTYFTVNVGCRAGINHLKSALSLLIKESLILNRTPVAFRPCFLPAHNFGKAVDAPWDKYLDLSRIAIIRNGVTSHVAALPPEAMVELDTFPVLEVKGKHRITAAENAEYPVIVKNNPSGLGHDAVYSHDDYDFKVELLPSCAVSQHADRLSRQLGEYHSIHVRRGDMVIDKSRCPNLERDTQPQKIYETVSRVLAKGSRVYILTNEGNPHYFDLLKKDYQVFQHFDFPELQRFVEGDDPDNFFLYEIEQLMFDRAKTRIHTFAHPKGKPRISLTTDVGWT